MLCKPLSGHTEGLLAESQLCHTIYEWMQGASTIGLRLCFVGIAIAKMFNAMMFSYGHAEFLALSVTNIPLKIIDDSAYHKVSGGCRALAQNVKDSLEAADC